MLFSESILICNSKWNSNLSLTAEKLNSLRYFTFSFFTKKPLPIIPYHRRGVNFIDYKHHRSEIPQTSKRNYDQTLFSRAVRVPAPSLPRRTTHNPNVIHVIAFDEAAVLDLEQGAHPETLRTLACSSMYQRSNPTSVEDDTSENINTSSGTRTSTIIHRTLARTRIWRSIGRRISKASIGMGHFKRSLCVYRYALAFYYET